MRHDCECHCHDSAAVSCQGCTIEHTRFSEAKLKARMRAADFSHVAAQMDFDKGMRVMTLAMVQSYLVDGLSTRQVGDKFGVSHVFVAERVRRFISLLKPEQRLYVNLLCALDVAVDVPNDLRDRLEVTIATALGLLKAVEC